MINAVSACFAEFWIVAPAPNNGDEEVFDLVSDPSG
jgi:hypothetical protein